MKFSPKWSPLPTLVTTATSQRSKAKPSRNMPPRAVSSTAASTSGCCNTLRALFGPLQSPVSMRSPCTYTPSVLVMPTRQPCCWNKCAINLTVVVLPLVPVTATTGMRPLSLLPNMVWMMASPTARPLPNEGDKCIRKPGAAFTSTTPPPWVSRGCKMLSHTMSTPQMSSPTILAAATARAAIEGCTSSVTSVAVPPVDKLALCRRFTRLPLMGTESAVMSCAPKQVRAMSSKRILVRDVACPVPRRGSLLTCSTSSLTLCRPSPTTLGASRRAAATSLSPTTSSLKSLPGK